MEPLFPDAINSRTRVLVVGLGRFGGQIGAIRWLCRRGAAVTVTDLADERQLADSLEKLKGLKVRLRLGGHETEDFLRQDLLVVSPAVPPGRAMIRTSYMATHTREHLDRALAAFGTVGHELGVIG